MREPTREEWRSWTLAIEPPRKPSHYVLALLLSGMSQKQAYAAEDAMFLQMQAAPYAQLRGIQGGLVEALIGRGFASSGTAKGVGE